MAASDRIRIACCQLEMRAGTWPELAARIEAFVADAADADADFILFPELYSCGLAARGEPLSPDAAVDALTALTGDIRAELSAMAVRHGVNIIGGTHLTQRETGVRRNLCFVALRDGSVHEREKVHPTPDEAAVWRVSGGGAPDAIDTDRCKIGVLICYDSEFPELGRRLADQDAQILFVPFCTEGREGYMRVRHCSAARAVENQCYVALAGNVGTLEGVENMDVQYAQSCVLTPCDTRFPTDGIAAEAEPGIESLIFADLDVAALDWARESGSVRNLADRRGELYRIEWSPD